MQISTDNGPIRNMFGDLEAIRLIRQAGFDGIDYTFYKIDPANDILNLPDEQRYALACEIRNCAEKYGISFPQSHAPHALKFVDDKSAKSYQDILRSLEFAYWIGCKQIVIHTVRCPVEDKTIDPFAHNLRLMKEFIPYAEKYDIYIGIENLYTRDKRRNCYLGRNSTPEDMNRFVEALESDRFRVCCDTGHANITGTEAEDFIRGMSADRLTMLHVHDTDYCSDMHTLPYLGKHNWEAFAKALADIDFKGTMNLEILHFYDKFPRDLVPSALQIAAQTARNLANKVEMYKK